MAAEAGEHKIHPDETQIVVRHAIMGMQVRPGKLMPQRIHDAFERADVIVDEWHRHSADTFNWSFGDFTGGELEYDDPVAKRLDTIPAGEKLLKFTMFPSAGRALAIRNSGELVEFEIKFVRVG